MMERRPLVAIGQKATDQIRDMYKRKYFQNISLYHRQYIRVDLDIVHLKQCWPVCIIVFLSKG